MKSNNKGVLLILAAASMWGTAGFFVRSLKAAGIETMQTVFARALLSLIIIAIMIFVSDKRMFHVKLRDLWLFGANGILSVVMFNYCYYKTMALSTLSIAAVLLYTAPFFVIFISAVLFKEKLTPKKLLACVSAFIGCCFVSGIFSGGLAISGACVVYGLLTGFGYALYTIFGNLLLKRGYQSLTINFYTFAFATIGSLPFINVVDTFGNVFSGFGILIIAVCMALFNTVLPYLCYTNSLKWVAPSKALIIATVEPVVATLIGILLYGEPLTLHGVVGILLVVSAVVILNVKTGRFE